MAKKKFHFKINGSLLTIFLIVFILGLLYTIGHIVIEPAVETFVTKHFPTPTPTMTPEEMSQQIIVLTNQEREKAGLTTLTENDLLDQAAKDKAEDMIKRNYFEHYAPSDSESSTWQFIKQEGYNYLYAGENLGRGYFTASSEVDAWMASEEHKKNILSPNFTDIGVYVVTGEISGEKNIIAVQEFASPNSGTVANANTNAQLTISQVQSYCNNINNITPSWENAKSKYPQDIMSKLLDSFARQINFCNQIISDYNKYGRFSGDDISLWNSVNQMGNETYQITTQLNNSK